MMNTVTVHEYKKQEEWKVSGGEKMEEEAIGQHSLGAGINDEKNGIFKEQ